jgi:hypothetical protein
MWLILGCAIIPSKPASSQSRGVDCSRRSKSTRRSADSTPSTALPPYESREFCKAERRVCSIGCLCERRLQSFAAGVDQPHRAMIVSWIRDHRRARRAIVRRRRRYRLRPRAAGRSAMRLWRRCRAIPSSRCCLDLARGSSFPAGSSAPKLTVDGLWRGRWQDDRGAERICRRSFRSADAIADNSR